MRPADTSPEAWKVFLELHRLMPPSEKLRRTLEFSDTVRQLARDGLRQRYPDADDRGIFLKMAQLILGRELFRQVYADVGADDGRTGQRA